MVLNQPSELYEVIAKSLALKLLAQTTETGATGVGAPPANAQLVPQVLITFHNDIV